MLENIREPLKFSKHEELDRGDENLLLSVETEGRAELPQHVQLQVNVAECEENAEEREADENPENVSAEVERRQTAGQETERQCSPSTLICYCSTSTDNTVQKHTHNKQQIKLF